MTRRSLLALAARFRIVHDFGPILLPSRTLAGTWSLAQIERPSFRVLALSRGHVVGALSYERTGAVDVRSCGTFVSRNWRRHGLASRLWSEMLRREKPRRVFVGVASDRGLTLVESLRKKYPRVRWLVSESGERKLRDRRAA